MAFPEADDVEDLSADAVKRRLSQVIERLHARRAEIADLDPETQRSILNGLLEGLEAASEEDGMGTEGWQHFLGLEG